MNTRARRTAFVLLAGLCVIAGLAGTATAANRADPGAARVPYATIEGTGSTWSELIVQKWIADVDANGMSVVYTGGGSTKGRKDFAQNSVDFAISEIPYQGVDENGNADTSNGRDFAYLPIVAGGTAFSYQLKIGNEQVRNLRLSGETLAKIFTNKITNWNDPQITEDNNGREFPDLAITPVVRADGSGTTAQLTTWMDKEYPSIWRPYFGQSGLTSYYPVKDGTRMTSQAGSDQVMNTIKSSAGNGYIGYVEYAYPVNADYPVVKVLNKAGYFVEPTQWNTAVALTRAQINQNKGSQDYLTQILDGVYRHPDPRAYPISSYSYMLIPTGADDQRMTTSKRQTLADFIYYSLCSGQTAAGPYGYSPLPLNLVQAGFQQVAKLKQADNGVDLTDRDVRSCNNPTFDGKNPNRNLLAEQAPMPPECDKIGQGPCGTDTGNNDPGGEGEDPDGSGPAGPDDGGTGPDDGTGGTEIDPETGEPIAPGDSGTTGEAAYATSTLVEDRPGDSRTFGWLAVAELAALVLVPGLFVSFVRRRRSASGAAPGQGGR
ncbi:phosphate ABC transporter phosphate-binding protein [Nocardioides thalensis]|uniref:Phosphate ABC transporter phosphate-binding protein n=1 Tax=Nocardioides thalensis TaxID=1914755 RepID=A0A853BYM5_9ACTN|nr:substrate-binding domain-containing protein [Nocardioides thalensis]NYJ00305.1 phosphate ABC transporter phosphate-binding protein [Nocardioides thalensis]